MKNAGSKLALWEGTGALFIIIVGSLLHFTFAWSGNWYPLALVSAVNESVWEHLKLAFWPGLIWALIESRYMAVSRAYFWAVKSIALLLPTLIIPAIFYSYTSLLGTHILIIDIASFVVAVAVAQTASFVMLKQQLRRPILIRAGLVLGAVQVVAFACFTYFAPDHFLFIETRSGLRGIIP